MYIPLVSDWVSPGFGLDETMRWLDPFALSTGTRRFPLWGWLVGRVGMDVAALGGISAIAGMIDIALTAFITGGIFNRAITKAKEGCDHDFACVESAGILLASAAFALTPGLLQAATRMGPLTVALIPPLMAAALAVGAVKGSRLRKCRLALALGIFGYSLYELIPARRVFVAMAFPSLPVWFAVGIMPALIIAWCVRRRWLTAVKAQLCAFGIWALAVFLLGMATLMLHPLEKGMTANRMARRIITEAGEAGARAIVCDQTFDDLFAFLVPEGMKVIRLVYDREPAYGRELEKWTGGIVKELAISNGEDIVFAAALGTRTMIDEWAKVDREGFGKTVVTAPYYYPTPESWYEAVDELSGMTAGEPFAENFRRLVGVTGTYVGCRLAEAGDLAGAWRIFTTIIGRVDPVEYTAMTDIIALSEQGYVGSAVQLDEVKRRHREISERLKTSEAILEAVRAGGKVLVSGKTKEKAGAIRREAAAKRELSAEEAELIKALSTADTDPEHARTARDAIREALRDGRMRLDAIGGRLIMLDFALGEPKTAEKDAIDVLRSDRHDPTANAALGAMAGVRGDFAAAERYLHRALASGRASIGAYNDYAYTLMRLGRLEEAEPYAREAVRGYDAAWWHHETLATILIRLGKYDEGERELARVMQLTAGIELSAGKRINLDIDRAMLLKARGRMNEYRAVVKRLRRRKDLDEGQRQDMETL